MRRYWVGMFKSGIPFGLIMALVFSHAGDWHVGVPAGLCAGFFFGLGTAVFLDRQRHRFQIERPDFSGEQLLWEGPANHFLHGEGVGGWLYLTTRRLLFRSHRFNLQPHETDLPLADISDASPALTIGFIPNGLLVCTVSGRRERFVVGRRKRWSAEISNARKRLAELSGAVNATG